MNPKDLQAWIATLLRFACGFLLLYASVDKVGDAAKFLGSVKEYHILPHSLAPLAAVAVPWLEFFIGLCLVLGLQLRGAALLYCSLMLLYSAALAWNLIQGVEMNCGCFGGTGDKVTWWTVGRDLFFLAMGLPVLLSPRTFFSLERSTTSDTRA